MKKFIIGLVLIGLGVYLIGYGSAILLTILGISILGLFIFLKYFAWILGIIAVIWLIRKL